MNIKSKLDKFYTKTELAKYLVSTIPNKYDLWVEPSAGAGAFLKFLPIPRIGLDVEPDDNEIIQQDFFTYKPISQKIIVIGNPPFGYQAKLAIDFFNYAATFATTIAFIVPRTFRKLSIQNRLSLNFELVYEEILPKNSFILLADNGITQEYDVSTCWQIWNKIENKRSKIVLRTNHKDWVWCNKENAKYAMRRVGGLAGKVFIDNWKQYSSESHYYFNCTYEVFEKLNFLYPVFQEISKNVSGNPSIGKGEIVLAYTENDYLYKR
jgi:hypothetical protein